VTHVYVKKERRTIVHKKLTDDRICNRVIWKNVSGNGY